jgi:uracil permease
MVVGLNSLVRAGKDLTEARNLTIGALILVFGSGGMTLSFGKFSIGGIGLAGILGVLLNLVLPGGRSAQKRQTALAPRPETRLGWFQPRSSIGT